MGSAVLDRWLLVNYAGYPFGANSLMPDNGLASLAGCLMEDGRTVRILDYAALPVMADFTSPGLTRRLNEAWDTLCPPPGAGPPSGPSGRRAWRRLRALASLHGGERRRARLQSALLRRIAGQIESLIRAGDIQCVGFKLWNGDGLLGSVFLAGEVRRRCPGVKVFGGGPHVDIFMEDLLAAHDVFDALAFGEGEETVRHLAASGGDRRSYAGIPNLLFRDDGTVRRTESRIVADLDRLPMPVYDAAVYPAMEGNGKIRIIVLDESRGCRNHCAFCIHPVKSHHTLRVKGVARLMSEIGNMDSRHGIRTFRFAGSCTPYGLLHDFAAAARVGELKCAYSSFAHLRGGEEADFGSIAASGCVALFFGVESGSQAILNRMGKGVRAGTIAPTIRRAAAAGIFPVGSLIFPAPGETDESARETLAVLAEARPGSVTIQAPLVVPMTDWFENAGRYGIAMDRARYVRTLMHWKAKLLMPPSFWSPLPVSVDGRSFKQVLKRTSEMVARVEQLGIPTAAADDTYLMSVKAGMDFVEFRDATRKAFFAGDADGIRGLVERINARP
jgi:hypothetical protein